MLLVQTWSRRFSGFLCSMYWRRTKRRWWRFMAKLSNRSADTLPREHGHLEPVRDLERGRHEPVLPALHVLDVRPQRALEREDVVGEDDRPRPELRLEQL